MGQFFLAQAGRSWTLGPGLILYILAFYCLRRDLRTEGQSPASPLRPTWEIPAFLTVAIIGLLLRWPLAHFPEGVFADRAEVADGALRVLHAHWRPFLSALSLHVPELPIYYLTALWFALFGSTPRDFAWFDAVLSFLGILLACLFFRRVAPPRAALLAFFILAVMRWNFAFAHQVYFQAQVVLFSMAALAAFYGSLRSGKVGWAVLAGVLSGAGLYAYQATKALPIMLAACLVFEYFRDQEELHRRRKVWISLGVGFLAAAVPYFYWAAQKGEIGRRDAQVSILMAIHQAGNLSPILVNLKAQLFMFNRLADNNTQADFARHRMLDDGTGVLFVLGFLYALTRLKERPYFLAAAGTVVFCLPSLLSVDAGHAGRSLGATPFIALAAGLLLEELWRRAQGKLPLVFGAALLAFIGWQNWHDYFQVQRHDPACRNDCSWAESRVGELVARDGGNTEFFLTSRFEGHPTVLYLAGNKAAQCRPFDPSALPAPMDYPKGTAFCFFLEGDAGGMLEYLKACYPGGEVGGRENPLGETALIGYRVGPQALAKLGKAHPGSGRGLLGTYAHSDAPGEKSFLKRLDPVLNFGFRDLPGTGSPLFIHWQGTFRAARAGDYEWVAVTAGYGQAGLKVDGRSVAFTEDPRLSLSLVPGPHRLDIWYRQPATPLSELHLLWRPPGGGGLVFMPNGVWEKVTK